MVHICAHCDDFSLFGISQKLDHILWESQNKPKEDLGFELGLLQEVFKKTWENASEDVSHVAEKFFRVGREGGLSPKPASIGSSHSLTKVLEDKDLNQLSLLVGSLKENNLAKFKECLHQLPKTVQEEIFHKHWKIMGEPTEKSKDPVLQQMAHFDFGRVSLCGTEPHCDVSVQKKIDTLSAYLEEVKLAKGFSFLKQLDRIEWKLKDQCAEGITQASLQKIHDQRVNCHDAYLKGFYSEIQLTDSQGVREICQHYFQKYSQMISEITSLTSLRPPIPDEPLIPFSKTEFHRKRGTFSGNILHQLNQISEALRTSRESEAFTLFQSLPRSIKMAIHGALCSVRGMSLESMEDVAEMSFHDYKGIAFASTPQQKACAVELVKLSSIFMDLLECLRTHACEIGPKVQELPIAIQNQIFGVHWKVMGSPTNDSQDEDLRKMAHEDFGRVSFLDLESRCRVPDSKKKETLERCLSDYKEQIAAFQDLLCREKSLWKKWTDSKIALWEKEKHKRESLLKLAQEIVPFFEGSFTEEVLSEEERSYSDIAKDYVKRHPCLKPFFLQLMPYLPV